MNNIKENNKTRAISELLKDKHFPLAELCKKASEIQKLNLDLKSYLDPSLVDHFELANIKTDVATLLVSSSGWATRLRYNIPTILNVLNNQLNFTSIKTIRIKVKKLIINNQDPNIEPFSLSKNSAKFLADTASSFNDTELRDCILKLSKNKIK